MKHKKYPKFEDYDFSDYRIKLEQKIMNKKKAGIILPFSLVAFINVCLYTFFIIFNNVSIKESIAVYLFSLFAFWFFYLVYYISEIYNVNHLVPFMFLLFSFILLIVFSIKIKDDRVFLIPIMFVFSISVVSFYWSFIHHKEDIK